MTDIYAPPASSLLQAEADGINYASRWRRLAALAVDLCVFLIAIYFLMFFVRANQTLSYYFVPVHGFSFALYWFYKHGVNGQTIGKQLLRIRVVRRDGGAIGFAISARRTILHALASVPWVVAKMIALAQIPPSQFTPLNPAAMNALEQSLTPAWWEPVSMLLSVHIMAELLCFLFSTRRQTLSDLIAGTVVVNLPSTPAPAQHDARP